MNIILAALTLALATGHRMLSRWRHFWMAAALLVLQSAVAAAPDSYTAAPIGGRVVDAATGTPLAGAVVVAAWSIHRLLYLSGDEIRQLEVQEVLTDTEGRYRLPGWGPIARPAAWGMLGGNDPRIAVFKPGYEPEIFLNSQPGPITMEFNKPDASLRLSLWDGKDLAVQRYGAIDRRSPTVVDPGVGAHSPQAQSLTKLYRFAAFLEDNIRGAEDSADAPASSERRMLFMQRQREALLMTDDALRELTGRSYDPRRWTAATQDFVRSLPTRVCARRSDGEVSCSPSAQ